MFVRSMLCYCEEQKIPPFYRRDHHSIGQRNFAFLIRAEASLFRQLPDCEDPRREEIDIIPYTPPPGVVTSEQIISFALI
jgi:hypothetical protein